MKGLNNFQCPHCKHNNNHITRVLHTNIWDDSFYEFLDKELNNSVERDTLTYECKCDGCGKPFYIKAELHIELKSISTTIEMPS